MAYSNDIKEKAKSILQKRRAKSKDNLAYNKNKIYNEIPILKEIDQSLFQTGFKVSKAILMSDSQSIDSKIKELETENLSLQQQKNALLKAKGYSQNDLSPQYFCEKCKDTGYTENGICDCYKELLKQLSYEKLSEVVEIAKYRFDNFSLDFYSNDYIGNTEKTIKDVMSNILSFTRQYAENFNENSQSLLFLGGTGLGKTHLSVAIAGYVIEKSYNVIYASAQNLLYKLEKERFSKDISQDNYSDYMKLVLECDLLILDDLGAEFPTSFTVSTIYNIVNSRLLTGKATIISSNLDSTQKLEERYSERFVSRLLGNYNVIKFWGKDIRIQKRNLL